jgi:diguanylate cyclase (GGDEF)-like protein/PAS domain S-box-containing protein
MLDPDMKYLACSQRWLQEYGRGYADLLGVGHYEINPDIGEVWKAVYRRGLAGETVRNDEDIWRQADGSEHWLRWFVMPWHDEKGAIGGIIISIDDLTERKQIEPVSTETLARLGGIVDSATDAIITVDEEMRVSLFNPAAERMFGYSAEEIYDQTIDRLIPVGLQQAHRRHIQRFGKEGVTSRSMTSPGQLRAVRSDGSEFLIEASISKASVGGEQYFTAIVRDVTERNRTQNLLRESEMRLRALIEQSPIGLATSRDGVTVDVNAVYLQMFGYDSAAEVCGQPVIEQIAPRCRADVEGRIKRRMRGESVESSYESIGLRKDGSQFPIFISANRIEFNDGPLTFAFLIDISRQKASEEEIRRLAFYDHLTSLPNRRLLQDRLEQALRSSQRTGRYGALLFIDLDDFKSLNDTMGHDTGDALLQQVAVRLKSCVRESDSVARLGGDEFVVILEDLGVESVGAAQQTESISTKIFATLNAPYRLVSHEYHCTASIGVTLFGDQKQTNEELIKQADIAMYQAKKAGRNNMRFFDPKMQETINAQATLEGELRQALERRQFQLFYQIQVDGANRPFGAEALIRWIHPERGLISPARFIALAEDTELILPIGQWVVETACAQIKIWAQNALTRDLVLCINVSAKQFYRSDFVDSVRNAVQRNAINPGRLILELTESVLLEDIEDTIATMKALCEFGVRFSLDDFGTGYSSLQYLKRLPLHQLKIDQSFVRDITVDSSDVAIVQTIIAMARSLNLGVIAEGVETEEQRQILIGEGCDEFQGYLFGRPVVIEEFDAALSRSSMPFGS